MKELLKGRSEQAANTHVPFTLVQTVKRSTKVPCRVIKPSKQTFTAPAVLWPAWRDSLYLHAGTVIHHVSALQPAKQHIDQSISEPTFEEDDRAGTTATGSLSVPAAGTAAQSSAVWRWRRAPRPPHRAGRSASPSPPPPHAKGAALATPPPPLIVGRSPTSLKQTLSSGGFRRQPASCSSGTRRRRAQNRDPRTRIARQQLVARSLRRAPPADAPAAPPLAPLRAGGAAAWRRPRCCLLTSTAAGRSISPLASRRRSPRGLRTLPRPSAAAAALTRATHTKRQSGRVARRLGQRDTAWICPSTSYSSTSRPDSDAAAGLACLVAAAGGRAPFQSERIVCTRETQRQRQHAFVSRHETIDEAGQWEERDCHGRARAIVAENGGNRRSWRPSSTAAGRNHAHQIGVYTSASAATFRAVCANVPSSPATVSRASNHACDAAPSAAPNTTNREERARSGLFAGVVERMVASVNCAALSEIPLMVDAVRMSVRRLTASYAAQVVWSSDSINPEQASPASECRRRSAMECRRRHVHFIQSYRTGTVLFGARILPASVE